jgi:hypothetical protein
MPWQVDRGVCIRLLLLYLLAGISNTGRPQRP